MSQPTTDDVDVDTRLQEVNRGGASEHMRGDVSVARRRIPGRETGGESTHALVETETCQVRRATLFDGLVFTLGDGRSA